ncbi:MAG: AI-2E family transporter [Oscillospiraceae bacterium]|nr:AI-2E family transporter [Oscillospiraceae bacterium]
MLKKDSQYFRLGLTLLTVIILSALFIVALVNIGIVFEAFKKIISFFSFVIWGLVFAYVMNPILKLIEKLVKKLLGRTNMTERTVNKLSRILGVLLAVLTFLAIIYGLLAMVLPELYESITTTFSPENLQKYYDQITGWLSRTLQGTPLENWLVENDPLRALQEWITEKIDLFSTIGSVVSGAYDVGKGLLNVIVGLVVSVYLLIDKERYISQFKKFMVAVFKGRWANKLFEIGRFTNRSFGGFMVGKVIDSFIIGLISYIGMLILGLPYALISSTFVGISNIIPFFGPLIGIVIGGVLILLQSPSQALIFLIFEIILQQVDGNFIGPKILGGRMGISGFWVLFSITFFGSVFSFPGMLVGVPVFTVIYALCTEAVNNSLKKKNLTLNTGDYYSILVVEDLEQYEKEFGEPTVFYSGDTFETEYDPDEDFEFEDPEA